MRRLFYLLVVALFVVVTGSVVELRADGGFTPSVETAVVDDPTAPSQRAIIIHDAGQETLILQTKFRGKPQDFGWIVPVPSNPESFDTCPEKIFEETHTSTQPRITIERYSDDGNGSIACTPGCASSDNAGGGRDTLGPDDVDIWQQLQVGPYDITVLSATEPDALMNWLDENGYRFPEGASGQEIADHYIQKGWYFVAIKIHTEEQGTTSVTAGVKPLVMVFPSDKIVYPLEISRISAEAGSEITLYILAEHKVECVEFETKELDTSGITELHVTYDEVLFPQARGKFVIEYANSISLEDSIYFNLWPFLTEETYFLTRMTTYLTRDEMIDLSFKYAPDDEPFVVDVYITLGALLPNGVFPPLHRLVTLSLLFIALLLYLTLPRRRRILAPVTAAILMAALVI